MKKSKKILFVILLLILLIVVGLLIWFFTKDLRLSKEEKLEKLKNLGMRVDDRIEEGVGKMCNMGDYIEAKAIKKGMLMGKEREVGILRTQLEKKKRTPKETAELLELPLGYIQSIADMLQKDAGASDLQIAERLMNIRI